MHHAKHVDWSRVVTLPRIILNKRQLCDLELIGNGGFAPLTGFLTEEEYRSVVETMRLPDGSLWPMPVVLDVRTTTHTVGDEVVLCDEYETPRAVMQITSVYTPDKVREAEMVYGTTDPAHWGVAYLFEKTGDTYLGGPVEMLSSPEHADFPELRHTPASLRAYFKEQGIERVLGFQTRNPLHRAHVALLERAASEHGAHILLHPSVGMTKDGDIGYVHRVKCYATICDKYFNQPATLSLLPLAMRMAGPREALWHALIRKNHGCTHFLVGRDHAGPGADKSGTPFYDPYAAQELALAHAEEIGITIVPVREFVYVPGREAHLPVDEVAEGEETDQISGTEVRRRLRAGEDLPAWFAFPEVVAELRRDETVAQRTGAVIFFTGLSGAGKSTIARRLAHALESAGRMVTVLDGDVVRQHLSKGLGFSREDRDTNVERIGFVAAEIARHGGIAICAPIAPYAATRRVNRERVSAVGTYVEVFVDTPLSVCKERDVKGLYHKAERGLAKGVTGIDDPYEVPENAELVIDASLGTPEDAVATILALLKEKGIIV